MDHKVSKRAGGHQVTQESPGRWSWEIGKVQYEIHFWGGKLYRGNECIYIGWRGTSLAELVNWTRGYEFARQEGGY